jgi:hypothetical protein
MPCIYGVNKHIQPKGIPSMVGKKKSRANAVPLIVEDHPKEYDGYPFITLIQYRKTHVLSIVDNSDENSINLYVLDLCGPENVKEERVIEIASYWYDNNKKNHPFSVEVSRHGLTPEIGKIYRTFNTDFVTRVIGPLPRFEMSETVRVKRRKRKPVQSQIEVQKSGKVITLESCFVTMDAKTTPSRAYPSLPHTIK